MKPEKDNFAACQFDCPSCSGTGEGSYDGKSCMHCGGSGIAAPQLDIDEYDEPYSD